MAYHLTQVEQLQSNYSGQPHPIKELLEPYQVHGIATDVPVFSQLSSLVLRNYFNSQDMKPVFKARKQQFNFSVASLLLTILDSHPEARAAEVIQNGIVGPCPDDIEENKFVDDGVAIWLPSSIALNNDVESETNNNLDAQSILDRFRTEEFPPNLSIDELDEVVSFFTRNNMIMQYSQGLEAPMPTEKIIEAMINDSGTLRKYGMPEDAIPGPYVVLDSNHPEAKRLYNSRGLGLWKVAEEQEPLR